MELRRLRDLREKWRLDSLPSTASRVENRVNARNNKGETPLQKAVSRDHTDVASVLRRAGSRT